MIDYLKIIAAMLIWSTWGLLIRWMALPAIVVLFYTSLIGGITVPAILAFKREFPRNIFDLKAWHLIAGIAAASIVNNISFFYALGHTSVANAVFTHYTAPIIVAVLAPFMIGEHIRKVTMVALPVAVVGMTMIVMADGVPSMSRSDFPGIISGTVSGFGYAILIIFTRRLGQLLLHQKAIIVLLWITVLVTAPMVLAVDYSLDLRTGSLLFLTGIFHSSAALLMYFSALRRVVAQHAAVLGYMEPLSAIPLAYVFLSERPPFIALFGGGLILLSGYLIIRSKLRE
jgi:drug/metabolite transporter (DMT)-like permease